MTPGVLKHRPAYFAYTDHEAGRLIDEIDRMTRQGGCGKIRAFTAGLYRLRRDKRSDLIRRAPPDRIVEIAAVFAVVLILLPAISHRGLPAALPWPLDATIDLLSRHGRQIGR
jgi:hypothetical protein